MRAAQNHDAAKSVWITRAEPGAAATAERVAAIGFSPIIAPLLTFRPLPADLELKGDEALAFTSANAVSRTAALTDRRDVAVFAVGDATAEAARAAGFHDVASAHGDVETLAAVIIRFAGQRLIVHPAARETAGDLVGRLKAAGVAARKVAIYETCPAAGLPSEIEAALAGGRLAAALFHSPKAARVAAALLGQRDGALRTVCAVGLSSSCIAPLRALGFNALIAAVQPNDACMLDALAKLADTASP